MVTVLEYVYLRKATTPSPEKLLIAFRTNCCVEIKYEPLIYVKVGILTTPKTKVSTCLDLDSEHS